MTGKQIIRLLFSILLIPIGAVLILLNVQGAAGDLLSKLGLALIVAGVVSTFREGVIRRLEGDEVATVVATKVHDKLKETPLAAIGIRLVSAVRKGYPGYYLWAIDNDPQEMFFAGRSVLHRIDADFRERTIGTAESLIARRLSEGASFKIMFLDPRSEMIPRFAREEGQTTEQLLSDIATSLGICGRLYNILQTQKLPLPPKSSIDIRVFDEVPYFAYHRVGNQVIIGFYFSLTVGHQSAAYEVIDPQTKEFFGEHFSSIFGRASDRYVLRIHPHRRIQDLNLSLIVELRKSFVKVLGEGQTEQLMGKEDIFGTKPQK